MACTNWGNFSDKCRSAIIQGIEDSIHRKKILSEKYLQWLKDKLKKKTIEDLNDDELVEFLLIVLAE